MAWGLDEDFKKLLLSKQYNKADQDMKKVIVKAYQDASPEDRKRFIYGDEATEGLTVPEEKSTQELLGTVAKAVPSLLKHEATKTGKMSAATGIDIAGQAGGAAVGGAIGGMVGMPGIGATLGEMGGAALADRANRWMGLREGPALDVPGERYDIPADKKVVGPITTGDIVAALPTAVTRGLSAGGRFLTGPGRQAITKADDAAAVARREGYQAQELAEYKAGEANTAAAQKYNKELAETGAANVEEATRVQQMTAAQRKEYRQKLVDERNRVRESMRGERAKAESAVQDWRQKGEVLDREFKADMDKIATDKALTVQARADALAQRKQAWEQQRQAHNAAYTEFQKTGTEGVAIGDYGKGYTQARQLAGQAKDVDVSSFRESAKELGVEFRQPAEGVQYGFKRVTDALEGFGKPKDGTEEFMKVVGPGGEKLPKGATGGSGGVPLTRVMETQRRLGQVMNRMHDKGGAEYGAAKKLWSDLYDILEAQKGLDPTAAKAIETHQAAAKDFMRAKAQEDFVDLWYKHSSLGEGDTYTINANGLRQGFRDLVNKDRWFSLAFTPEEIATMKAKVDAVPQTPLGARPPDQPTPVDMSGRERSKAHTYGKAKERLAETEPSGKPDYSKIEYKGVRQPEPVEPRWQEAPEPPAVVEPQYGRLGETSAVPPPPSVGNFPQARTITGLTVGGMAGNAAARATGYDPYLGTVVGSAIGGAAVAVPHWVSKTLLKTEKGQRIMRNITGGKQALTPAQLAALTSAARALGGSEEDDAK